MYKPIFARYDATKIYWLGLSGYTVVSTLIFISVSTIYRIRETQFTKTAAILSHVIPVMVVLLIIHFGIYDLIQNLLKNKGFSISEPSSETIRLTDPRRTKMPPTPISKHMLYKSSGEPVRPENQSANTYPVQR